MLPSTVRRMVAALGAPDAADQSRADQDGDNLLQVLLADPPALSDRLDGQIVTLVLHRQLQHEMQSVAAFRGDFHGAHRPSL